MTPVECVLKHCISLCCCCYFYTLAICLTGDFIVHFLILFDRKLAGRTILITGASRGIGKAIALKAARDGANIVIAAKTAEPHPKLPGTIYTAAKESKPTRKKQIF